MKDYPVNFVFVAHWVYSLSSLQGSFAEMRIFLCLESMVKAQPHTQYLKGKRCESKGLICPNPLESLKKTENKGGNSDPYLPQLQALIKKWQKNGGKQGWGHSFCWEYITVSVWESAWNMTWEATCIRVFREIIAVVPRKWLDYF